MPFVLEVSPKAVKKRRPYSTRKGEKKRTNVPHNREKGGGKRISECLLSRGTAGEVKQEEGRDGYLSGERTKIHSNPSRKRKRNYGWRCLPGYPIKMVEKKGGKKGHTVKDRGKKKGTKAPSWPQEGEGPLWVLGGFVCVCFFLGFGGGGGGGGGGGKSTGYAIFPEEGGTKKCLGSVFCGGGRKRNFT